MTKYYRVLQDNFLWKKGAILKLMDNGVTYISVEDIWDRIPPMVQGKPLSLSSHTVEHPNNSEFFERVYPDNITGKAYRTKDQLLQAYEDTFKKG